MSNWKIYSIKINHSNSTDKAYINAIIMDLDSYFYAGQKKLLDVNA